MGAAAQIDVRSLAPLRGKEAKSVAEVEYGRLLQIMDTFAENDWSRDTDCEGWDVTAMMRHLLGSMEGNASVREDVHQLLAARRWARTHSASLTDGLCATQIADRSTLTPAQISTAVHAVWSRALHRRFAIPRPVRKAVRVPAETPAGKEWWTLEFLMDVIYTRDVWMHRIDLARATGKPLLTTAEHDGRIVADIVADWARRHGRPFVLALSGPAGATFSAGGAGDVIELDAVQFARVVSGREPGAGLLGTLVPF